MITEKKESYLKAIKHNSDLLDTIHSIMPRVPASVRDWLKWYTIYPKTQATRFKIKKYLPKRFAKHMIKLLGLSRAALSNKMYKALHNNSRIYKDGKIYIGEGGGCIALPSPANIPDITHFFQNIGDTLLPQLLMKHVPQEQVTSFCSYGEGPYELGHVVLEKGDIVIDVGASIGDFAALASSRMCDRVYAFEPSSKAIEDYLSKTAELYKNIEICQYALSDRAGVLSMENFGVATDKTRLDANNDASSDVVSAITLDDFVIQNKIPHVDFIKADIEGAERYMLKGAKTVLKQFAPKLAICTYHLPDDPQVIRELILDANPNYVIEEKFMKMYAYVPKYVKHPEMRR